MINITLFLEPIINFASLQDEEFFRWKFSTKFILDTEETNLTCPLFNPFLFFINCISSLSLWKSHMIKGSRVVVPKCQASSVTCHVWHNIQTCKVNTIISQGFCMLDVQWVSLKPFWSETWRENALFYWSFVQDLNVISVSVNKLKLDWLRG